MIILKADLTGASGKINNDIKTLKYVKVYVLYSF